MHSKSKLYLNSGSFLALATAVALSLLWAMPSVAADGSEDGAVTQFESNVRYVELKPTFVANFGPVESRKLMYVKTDITLKIKGAEAHEAAMYHLPALRHEVVMLLSRQSEESMATGDGRDAVLEAAKAEINKVLEAEEGEPSIAVEDVMFTNLLLQR